MALILPYYQYKNRQMVYVGENYSEHWTEVLINDRWVKHGICIIAQFDPFSDSIAVYKNIYDKGQQCGRQLGPFILKNI